MFSSISRNRFVRSSILLLMLLSACGSSDAASSDNNAQDDNNAQSNVEASQTSSTQASVGADTDLSNGSGTITVGDVTYVFATEFCADDEDGVFNQGTGIAPDGTPFAARIYAEPAANTVDVILGQDTMPGDPPPGMAKFQANSFRDETMAVTVEGTRVSGTGLAIDLNEVALEPGETVAVSFDGECTP